MSVRCIQKVYIALNMYEVSDMQKYHFKIWQHKTIDAVQSQWTTKPLKKVATMHQFFKKMSAHGFSMKVSWADIISKI